MTDCSGPRPTSSTPEEGGITHTQRTGFVRFSRCTSRGLVCSRSTAGQLRQEPEDVTVHSLRHSHIMHYTVDRGLPLPIVQKQVGHRSLKTTSVYLNPSTEKMAEAYRVARQQAGIEMGAQRVR